LRAEIEQSGATIAVISSEAFSRLKLSDVQLVREYLAEYDTKIVVYVREPFSRTLSDYKHRVKTGRYCRSFRTFVSEIEPMLVSYDQFIAMWEQCFGCDNVLVRLFDQAKKEPGLELDFLSSFCAEPGSFQGFRDRDPLNVSPAATVTNSLRAINRIEHSLGRPKLLRPVFRQIRRATRGSGAVARSLNRFTPEQSLYRQEDMDRVNYLASDSFRRICDRCDVAPD
jgi:hypothetical protein